MDWDGDAPAEPWAVPDGPLRQRSLMAQRLSSLPDDPHQLAPQLNYRTVLLPPSLGGLDDAGMLVPDPAADSVALVRDVADLAPSDDGQEQVVARRRVLLTRDQGDEWRILTLADNATPGETSNSRLHPKWTLARDAMARTLGMRNVAQIVLAADEDGPTRRLLLFSARETATSSSSNGQVTIPTHCQAAQGVADRMTQRLSLDETLQAAFHLAAEVHDLGKADRRWQKAIGNDDLENPQAKSIGNGLNWRALDGYRHEFGSTMAPFDQGSRHGREGKPSWASLWACKSTSRNNAR
ncbi:MAG: hypothetical protein NTY19_19820 [Planctomycetota bacterium]|nr:hypothetical protein [Planctomycetota bacterium]